MLHVLGSLSAGGIETWLVHMFRRRDLFSVAHEILLTKRDHGHHEEEVRRLGIVVHRLPLDRGRLAWLRSFARFLRAQGPFECVHSHVYLFSAAVLAVAKIAGVRSRIAHCHTARSRGGDQRTTHRLRRAIAIAWLKRVATRRIGVTEAAVEEIAGPLWRSDRRTSVLLLGLDFEAYGGARQRAEDLKQALGIARSSRILGHVGRFVAIKNHRFLLDSFAASLDRLANASLVLVGDGPDREAVGGYAKSRGIAERVVFAGTTDDIAAYMAMFDLLLLPSISEGLGIVCVEAQAAGTPVLASDTVPREVSVVPGAIEFLPLEQGPKGWARAMLRRLSAPPMDAEDSLTAVLASPFTVRRSAEELNRIYCQDLGPDC